MATIAEITGYLNELYPQETAEGWDAVGLTVGEPDARVSTALFAVDIDPIVVAEAIDLGANLIVTHHPLFLSGAITVAANTPKGRMVHDLITHGIGLYTAHTNADIAPSGVNDSLARLLEMQDCEPLAPSAHPAAHPGSGLGRVGMLPAPVPLREFADRIAEKLPATAHGVRVSGDLDRLVHRVAVCGGSGDSYLDAAHAVGADAYLTADLRHHRASEASHKTGAPALIDVAHFASEWPWLPVVSAKVADRFGIVTRVSSLNTDPWTTRLASVNEGGTR